MCAKKKNPVDLRHGDLAVAELGRIVKSLRLSLASLEGSLDAAGDLKVESLYTDGVTQGDRAAELLQTFAKHINNAVADAKHNAA